MHEYSYYLTTIFFLSCSVFVIIGFSNVFKLITYVCCCHKHDVSFLFLSLRVILAGLIYIHLYIPAHILTYTYYIYTYINKL